jgi:hypothetical protein
MGFVSRVKNVRRATVELSYDEMEVALIALTLRLDELLSIKPHDRDDLSNFELDHIGELQNTLNFAQHTMEGQMVDELEQDLNALRVLDSSSVQQRRIGILRRIGSWIRL